jgi:hypothetical protein
MSRNAGTIIMKLADGYNVQEDKIIFTMAIEKVSAINTKVIGF